MEVDDQGVVTDMDTPGDYRRIREKHGRGDIPEERECLLKKVQAGSGNKKRS